MEPTPTIKDVSTTKSTRSQSLVTPMTLTPEKKDQQQNLRRTKTVSYRMSLPNPDRACLVVKSNANRHLSEAGLVNSSSYLRVAYPGYPYAMMIRMRVVQIVSGILTALVGTVACIEERSRFTLSIGILSGFMTLMSATVSINLFRREVYQSLLPTTSTPLSSWIFFDRALTLKADITLFVLWFSTTISCLMMIGVSALALVDTNTNVFVIGVLEISFGVVILFSIVSTILLRVRYGIIS